MIIHRLAAGQEPIEIFGADGDHQAEPDRPPHGVAPADPVFEAEHALCRNAKGGNLFRRGGERGKLRARVAAAGRHPVARRPRVGHGFDGGKCFGRHDHQGALGIQALQRVMDMRAIDVGDKMAARPVMERCHRQNRHGRPEVGTADADIDHIVEPAAGADLFRKGLHPAEGLADARADLLPAGKQLRPVRVAQGGVQNGAAFGFVDPRAGEHGAAPSGHIGPVAQRGQRSPDLCVDLGLGIVEQHIAAGGAIGCRPFGVGYKQVFDPARFSSALQAFQVFKHGSKSLVCLRGPSEQWFRTAPPGSALLPAAGSLPSPAPCAFRRRRSPDAWQLRRPAPGPTG